MADTADALRCPSCRTDVVEWWRAGNRVEVVNGQPRKIHWAAVSDPDWTCAFCDYAVIRPSKLADLLDSIPVVAG